MAPLPQEGALMLANILASEAPQPPQNFQNPFPPVCSQQLAKQLTTNNQQPITTFEKLLVSFMPKRHYPITDPGAPTNERRQIGRYFAID